MAVKLILPVVEAPVLKVICVKLGFGLLSDLRQ